MTKIVNHVSLPESRSRSEVFASRRAPDQVRWAGFADTFRFSVSRHDAGFRFVRRQTRETEKKLYILCVTFVHFAVKIFLLLNNNINSALNSK